ncbi:ATP-binding protein [Kitasatospora sp. NPDC049285]|uniref:ATP-binding protein n=1 Tax=Kitasatospora sp. NPDC049285 TaxID=3157096 RepID=UPI003439B473
MAAEASSVPVLRRFAGRVVRQWGLAEAVEEAVRLIVTELASNAVRHSGSADLVLRISAGSGRLVLNVQDFGCWRPPRPAGPEAAAERCSGRGLDLVNAFAAHCEVTATAAGTLVAAELPLPDPDGPWCGVCRWVVGGVAA